MKALIIQYSSIGDVLISTVVANNLKKIYPEIKIDFLCYRKNKGVLKKNPQIDRIISVDSNRIYSLLFLYKYIYLVRSEKYDILIDLSVDFKSVVTTFFSKAKKKYGFHRPVTNIFYNAVIYPVSELITQTCTILENRLVILEQFLKDNPVPIDPQVKIYLTDEEKSEAKETMRNAGIKFTRPIIMLGVFGSNKYNTWTLGSMAKLIDYLWNNYRADLLFNYLPSQYKQVN